MKTLGSGLAALSMAFAVSACVGGDDPCNTPAQDGKLTLACAASFLEDEGLADRTRLEGIRVYQWPDPVQAGDMITEGISEGQDRTIQVAQESWLFLVDLHPGALWNHSAQYVLADRVTGELTYFARMSFPNLNGRRILSRAESLAQPAVRIDGFSYESSGSASGTAVTSHALTYDDPVSPNVDVPPASGPDYDAFPALLGDELEEERARRYQGDREGVQSEQATMAELGKCKPPVNDPSCANPKRLALVINGGNLYSDESKVAQALRANGYTTMYLSDGNWNQADPFAMDRPTTIAEVENAFNWLASQVTGCCDDVVVYIHAHGTASGLLELNPRQDVEDWDQFNQTGVVGTKTIGHPGGGYMSTLTLKGHLDQIKSCQTKVFLYSCYSGKHLENGLNVISDDNDNGCMCRTVMVTSSARQPTYLQGYDKFLEKLAQTGDLAASFLAYKEKNLSAQRRWVSPQVQSTDCVLCEDEDSDGITTGTELRIGTDPELWDSDGDGLGDGFEVNELGSSPLKQDTDGDQLSDADEVEFDSDPTLTDTDGDGVSDKNELFGGTKPRDPDSDDDGLNDGEEYRIGTNPNRSDTDGDGHGDGAEVTAGTDPLDPASHP